MQSLSVGLIISTLLEHSKISKTIDTIDIKPLSEVEILR